MFFYLTAWTAFQKFTMQKVGWDAGELTEKGYVEIVATNLEAAPTKVISQEESGCPSSLRLAACRFSSSYTMNCIAPCETCTNHQNLDLKFQIQI